MIARILSSVILLPPVIAAIWFGGHYFIGLMILMGMAAIVEWCRICSGPERNASTLAAPILFIAVVTSFILTSAMTTYSILTAGVLVIAVLGKFGKNGNKAGYWPVFGFLYISVAVISLLWMRADSAGGRYIIILFFTAVWATDIGAYAFGRTIGGIKLAPKISPNKTWAGLLGGVLCAGILVGTIVQVVQIDLSGIFPTLFEKNQGMITLVIVAGILAVIAQSGDLFESWFKRRFGVKDSGTLIPGHGGVLDRVDGVLLGAPMTAIAILMFQGEA